MNNQDPIRVLSVDDHSVLNEGIAAFIGNQADMRLIAQANSGSDAIEKFRGYQPDVTLMDLRLPDMSGRYNDRDPDRVPRGSHHHADNVRR